MPGCADLCGSGRQADRLGPLPVSCATGSVGRLAGSGWTTAQPESATERDKRRELAR